MSIQDVLSNSLRHHVENCDVFSGCGLLPDKSIHCIVSSPPYLGLRDYGIPPRQWSDGLICCYGLEPDVASYLRHTVELFEEFRRVLRDDGVIWWNVGDSYNGYYANQHATSISAHAQESRVAVAPGSGIRFAAEAGQKMLIPHRVAISLADAGWIVRQDNVWHKKSPMPESISGWRWVRCRVKAAPSGIGHAERGERRTNTNGFHASKWSPCPGCPKCEPNGGYILRKGSWRNTTGHEYIFQIVKSGEYFCDGDAAQEKSLNTCTGRTSGDKSINRVQGIDAANANYKDATNGIGLETRNPRSVWHLSSESYKGAHFATFPSELARRCLVPSLSAGGCCPQCGSQYAPRVNKERVPTRPALNPKVWRADEYDAISQRGELSPNRDPQRHIAVSCVDGYFPTCRCLSPDSCPLTPISPIVLEPFTGSGTTIQVATHLGFRAIGFEVNPQYIELAKERIAKVPRCLVKKKNGTPKRLVRVKEQLDLLFPE